MPRIATRRGLFWGSGIMRTTGLNRTLDRTIRPESWRLNRNFRRWLREHPEVTFNLPEPVTVPEQIQTMQAAARWYRRILDFIIRLLTFGRKRITV